MYSVLLFLSQIHETIESINQLKIQRDFMLSFSRDPKGYIQDWLKSQSRDLKVGRYGFYLHTRCHRPYSLEADVLKNMFGWKNKMQNTTDDGRFIKGNNIIDGYV